MCDTACSGCRSRSLGQGWVSAVGFLVFLASQHPWEPPDLCKVGGSPILGVEAGRLPCCVVGFSPPVGPGPVLPDPSGVSCAVCCRRRWRRSSLAVIWLLATCRTYRQAPGPLVEAVGADRVAAVFAELWAGRAPATWNTRRVAVQAFASWCGDRWPQPDEHAPRRAC